MQKKKNFFPVFMIFFSVAIFLFVFSRLGLLNGLTGLLEKVTVPLQRVTFGIFHTSKDNSSEISKLREENSKLVSLLVKQKELELENQALRDQFSTTEPSPRKLLPAHIIGLRTNQIVIDKGQSDGAVTGSAIVFNDNLIGKISKASSHVSIVDLLNGKNLSMTGRTVKTGALGVVKGSEDLVNLENVVLSEKLESGDIVRTKGDVDNNGIVIPANLVVGKIVSVNKKASNLFQSAAIKSLVDITRQDLVFVIL